MKIPLEITFRDVEKTESLERLIRERVKKLQQVAHHMTSCRIAVEKPQRHQRTGNPFRVRINMRVPPGHELVVRKEPTEGDMHDDLATVIRKTFNSARRQLKDLVERQQGEMKVHPEQETQAVVYKLFKDQGYGFIKTVEGRELYFHRNSVLSGDFDRLEIGTGVRFVGEIGDEGPQASTVQVVDKPGARVPKTGDEEIELPPGYET